MELKVRFCVAFVQVSPGDTGWDVFSLDYHVDGPISTVSIVTIHYCLCNDNRDG